MTSPTLDPPPGRYVGQRTVLRNDQVIPITISGATSIVLPVPVTLLPGDELALVWDGSHWVVDLQTTSAATTIVNPMNFGAVGDGVHDDWPAFKAAHDSLSGPGDWRGGTIHVPKPPVEFYLSKTWEITKRCIIEGEGMGYQSDTAGTRLVFAANTSGIRLFSGEPASPDGGSASYTWMRDFQLGAKTPLIPDRSKHGIHASTVIFADRVLMGDFPGSGMMIQANSALDGSGNANSSSVTRCQALSNGLHGFHLEGSDVNSTLLMSCFSSHNGGWQYNIESWLGCYLENCNAECGLGLGTYRTSGGGSHIDNCYLEYGSNYPTSIAPTDVIGEGCNFDASTNGPLIEISGDGTGATALVVGIGAGDGTGISTCLVTCRGSGYTAATAAVIRGGTLGGSNDGGARFTVTVVNGEVTAVVATTPGSGFEQGCSGTSTTGGGSGSRKIFGAIQLCQRTKGITRALDLWLGGYGTNGAPLVSASVADVPFGGGQPDRQDLIAWNDAAKCFESQFNHAGVGGIRYIHPLTTTDKGGRTGALPNGSIEFPSGYWLGDGANARFRGTGTAAPTTGEWKKGDQIDNIDAGPGEVSGWRCTTSGTPGTWKPLANVGA